MHTDIVGENSTFQIERVSQSNNNSDQFFRARSTRSYFKTPLIPTHYLIYCIVNFIIAESSVTQISPKNIVSQPNPHTRALTTLNRLILQPLAP